MDGCALVACWSPDAAAAGGRTPLKLAGLWAPRGGAVVGHVDSLADPRVSGSVGHPGIAVGRTGRTAVAAGHSLAVRRTGHSLAVRRIVRSPGAAAGYSLAVRCIVRSPGAAAGYSLAVRCIV